MAPPSRHKALRSKGPDELLTDTGCRLLAIQGLHLDWTLLLSIIAHKHSVASSCGVRLRANPGGPRQNIDAHPQGTRAGVPSLPSQHAAHSVLHRKTTVRAREPLRRCPCVCRRRRTTVAQGRGKRTASLAPCLRLSHFANSCTPKSLTEAAHRAATRPTVVELSSRVFGCASSGAGGGSHRGRLTESQWHSVTVEQQLEVEHASISVSLDGVSCPAPPTAGAGDPLAPTVG